jgi:hypothetical protein
MKMIPALPGSNVVVRCPDCKSVFNTNTGHSCTAKKAK